MPNIISKTNLHSINYFFLTAIIALVAVVSIFNNRTAISRDLPFFYNEDEAHHFNRVVDMVKSGDYNPHYFLKPSLHFYLRMPVVAVSFLWNVRKGHIKSVKDIRTKDPNGLSNYSLTASHPGLVKWQRAFSLLMLMIAISFSVVIAYQITGSSAASLLTGLILALSPAFPNYGTVVGVDAPMLLFCVLSVFFSLQFYNSKLARYLILAAVCAGFAMSSKYNALPILLAPFVVAVLTVPVSSSSAVIRLFIVISIAVIAFFVGSPYILVSIPEFLDHFAHEIWHYGVATREGHTASPGFEQLYLYGKWIAKDALGLLAALLGLAGIFILIKQRSYLAGILLIFPLAYFALMVMQRTHFERNMLVVLPFLAIGSGICFDFIRAKLSLRLKPIILIGLFVSAIAAPFASSQVLSKQWSSNIDSRWLAYDWLNKNTPQLVNTAVSGRLQLPLFQYTNRGVIFKTINGIDRLSPDNFDFFNLYLKGYDRLVFGPEANHNIAAINGFTVLQHWSGVQSVQRVVDSPELYVMAADISKLPEILKENPDLLVNIPELELGCEDLEEGHCWTRTRLVRLPSAIRNKPAVKLSMEVFSPWAGQHLAVITNNQTATIHKQVPSNWKRVTLELIPATDLLIISKNLSPAKHGESKDDRWLGVGYRKLRFGS